MKLTVKKVDETNYKQAVALKVLESQKHHIETVEACLIEAQELSLWRPVVIYEEDRMIGFAMYGEWKENGTKRVWLDRFFISSENQGKGYAKESLSLLMNRLVETYGCKQIFLSVYEDNEVAISLYQKMGFVFNGERDINQEKVMVKEIVNGTDINCRG